MDWVPSQRKQERAPQSYKRRHSKSKGRRGVSISDSASMENSTLTSSSKPLAAPSAGCRCSAVQPTTLSLFPPFCVSASLTSVPASLQRS
ncbi:hypothetical protein E2C01_056978 [Portunus trituberculatus]|uniref:Uncharacterized protein n=1 Tax=Portunus trituberculatus TaxID=210409 RepID=A0A5B7H130_PORTR|nr:hypothetical protein [Portunus trituberculatus]